MRVCPCSSSSPCSPPASAAAQDAPRPTLALVGGQVIDGYEGPPIHDGVVLIAGERIVAVGPAQRGRGARRARPSSTPRA